MESGERINPNANTQLSPTWRGAIAELIKEYRLHQGWTQEELGHRSGYDPVYINMLERGRRNPSIRALIDLCQALGVRPSVFMAEIERRLDGSTHLDKPTN